MNTDGRESVIERIHGRIRKKEEAGEEFTIGVAVGGGLLNGSFGGGVLEALDDLGLTPYVKSVVASSAGALPASFYATGIPISELKHSFIEPGHKIDKLQFFNIFYPNSSEVLDHIKRLILHPPILDIWENTLLPMIDAPARAVRNFKNSGELSLDFYRSILSWLPIFNPTNLLFRAMPLTGIFSGEKLEKYLEDNLEISSFKRLETLAGKSRPGNFKYHKLYITGCLLDQPGSRIVFGKGVFNGSIPQAAAASMAFPGFFKPYRIDSIDDWVIDGEIANVLSMDVILEDSVDLAIGSNIYVPYKLHPEYGSLKDMGLGYILQQTFLIMIGKKIERSLEYFGLYYPSTEIVLVQPSEDDPELFFRGYFNYRELLKSWDLGYRRTMEKMRKPVLSLQERGRFRTLINRIGFWSGQVQDYTEKSSKFK